MKNCIVAAVAAVFAFIALPAMAASMGNDMKTDADCTLVLMSTEIIEIAVNSGGDGGSAIITSSAPDDVGDSPLFAFLDMSDNDVVTATAVMEARDHAPSVAGMPGIYEPTGQHKPLAGRLMATTALTAGYHMRA